MVTERGALSLPLALAVAVSLTFGLGVWGLLHQYRGLVELQLRLDRCTGEKAWELKKTFERVQLLNRAIKAARFTLAAGVGTLQPQAIAAARKALEVAYLAQEGVIAVWRGKRALWWVRSCGGRGDHANALPGLPWTRDPPDPLGPKPLRWDSEDSSFRIQAWSRNRSAAARVFGEGRTDDEEPESWSLEWTR